MPPPPQLPTAKSARYLGSKSLTFIGLMLASLPVSPLAHSQTISRHPYLQAATPDSMTIVWRTVGGTVPIVRYGPAPDQLNEQVLPVQTVVRLSPDAQGPAGLPRLHSAPIDTFQYESTIFGLEPDATYYYGVFDGNTLLAGGDSNHHFTTLPAPGASRQLRLWATGDTGTGRDTQIAGFDAMRSYTEADGRPIDAYLHLGDMAYGSGLDGQFATNYFQIYTELLRNTVTWPTMGNHEGITSNGELGIGPYYDAFVMPTLAEAGGVPSGTEAYYSFDIGSAHFVCLNSHDLDRSPMAEMALWLKADLETTNAEWLIAFWHHPPYTKGTHDSDREVELIEMREFIMPILESGGVDLVLGGHSHVYERSMLIDGAYATPTTANDVVIDDGDGHPEGDGAYLKSAALNPNEGTIAIVAGNGYSAGAYYGVSPVMRAVIEEVGSLLIDIDGDTLTGRMLNTEGIVRDEFQLVKSGALPPPDTLAYPWQPVGPDFVIERLAPGETQVEVLAVPPAPDAVVHYSPSSGVPTPASPIYTGPLALTDTQSITAFSMWNEGQRTSMSATSPLVPAHYSIFRYPSSAMDDGFEGGDGTVGLGGDVLPIGGGGTTGVRFTDIRIPRGAYIVNSNLQFSKAKNSEYDPTRGFVYGERSPDSPPFTETPFELSNRAKTSAQPAWTVRAWTGVATRDFNTLSPSLNDVISEIIAQPGWGPGNAMSFFLQHPEGARTARSFDRGKNHSVTLAVTYIDPQGLGEQLARQHLSLVRISNGLYRLLLRWPAPGIATDMGLSFKIELSHDLSNWAIATPIQTGPLINGLDGFGTQFADFDPTEFPAGTPIYFRVRVFQNPAP